MIGEGHETSGHKIFVKYDLKIQFDSKIMIGHIIFII